MSGPTGIRILLAEDERQLGTLLQEFLSSRGHRVSVARDGSAALAALRAETFDVALLDIMMPELDGLQVLRHLRDEPSPPEVIVITGNATIETAIAAMRLGAYDFLSKPYRMAEIDVLVRRAWEKREMTRENARLRTRLRHVDPLPELVTRHEPFQGVLAIAARVAASTTPVLITGESGTGKELVARAIHRLSERGDGPLVDIACAAIGGSSVETELFGFESGTVAGAGGARAGMLELANGGTLFMDEVAALDPRMQGALLRVLEQESFLRVGGTQKVAMNARIITATNRNIDAMVSAGAFRDDLFYRINTIRLELPPLRDRRCDIPLIAAHFLARYGGATPPVLSEDALDALLAYDWPGNVRELRNVIERAVLLATDDEITADGLPFSAGVSTKRSAGGQVIASMEQLERSHIAFVLGHVRWHQGRAATLLGISSKTLYRKIREFGLQRPDDLPIAPQNAA